MKALRVGLIGAVLGMVFALAVAPAFAAIDDVYLMSAGTGGAQSDGDSGGADVSGDGRFVAFESEASNLVMNDTNNVQDIFVRDRWKGTTVRLMGPGGIQPDGRSSAPSISDDGRYVVYESVARNLAPGDINSIPDIFLSDTATGAVLKINNGIGGVFANNASGYSRISGDGKFVVYYSAASNLVAGDTNGVSDVFIYSVATGTTARVSVLPNGTQGNKSSYYASVSYDGRYVAFATAASNLGQLDLNNEYDVWRWDRTNGSLTPVSLTPAGALSNGDCDFSEISADGRYISFRSRASDVVAGDTNDYADVFVRDMTMGATQRVSMSTSGLAGNGDSSSETAISDDGRYVAFYSEASNLVVGDTNNKGDIFIRDRVSNTTTRVSVANTGVQSNGYSRRQRFAASGRFLVFESTATNLVPGDTNGHVDVFVKQLGAEPSSLTLTPSTATPAYDASILLGGALKANSADGAAIAGATVSLQKLTGGAWADVASAATAADGSVSFTVRPGVKAAYRLSYTGAPKTYDAVTSASVSIAPHPKVGTPVAPKSVKKSRNFTVYGSLKPKHTKNTKPVRIYKYRHVKVAGKWTWKQSGYVKAKAYNYKGYTRYKVKMKLTKKGTWRLRAYAPADSKHGAWWSAKYDTVKVK